MKPNTMIVLGMLATEKDGMIAAAIARSFSQPSTLQSRLRLVNSILAHQRAQGRVRRADKPEPSPFYHNIPTYRWRITKAGREYFDAGGFSVQQQEAHDRVIQTEQERLQRRIDYDRKLETLSKVPLPPPEEREKRDKLIRHMRQAGLTLADVGMIFGISRERVRQICEPSQIRRKNEPGRVSQPL